MSSPPLNSSKKNRKKKKKKAKSSTGANMDVGLDKVQNGYGESCMNCTCATGSKDGSSSESSLWRCSECNKEARSSPQIVQCTCSSCTASRELNHSSVGGDTDMSSTQSYWMEIRHVVRNIYRSTNTDNKPILNTDKMKNIVKRLCRGDPHQFFQRLETLAREYLLEVKVRLLEQLSLGFNSPQLAISFIEMLLDEYFTLADALPYLHQLLQPLEDSRYVDNLKLTVDLMNKNIFRELIFAESFMSSNLPLIIAQLRLASLSSDAHHRVMADKLNQQYSELDQEMEEIGHLWRAAKSDFAGFPPSIPIDQSKKAHIEEIRSDAESLKKMKQQQKQSKGSQEPPPAKPVTSKMVNQVVMPPTEEPKPFSACGLTNTHLCSKIKPLESVHLDSSGRTLKQSELSTILYHCMKPIGDADTVLDGDQVMQTYTLKLELSKLDLSNLSMEGHLSENDRYKDLGLSEEEMNDINLKLSALKAMGLDLQLEDLLDSGISLVEQNKAGMNGLQQRHSNGTSHLPNGKVFEGMWKKNGSVVAPEEMNGTTSSLSRTLFDNLVLKLRVSKKLSKKELEHYHLHGPEGLQFSCQDEAQLQVVRFSNIPTNGNCVGTFMGLEKECEDPMDNELFNSIHHHEVVRVLQQQLEQCTHEKDSVEALKSRGLVTTGKSAASKCEKLEKTALTSSSEKSSVQKEPDSSNGSKATSSNSSQPSDVDLSKLKPVIVPSNNTSQGSPCAGPKATNCNHSETVMHSVHKIQLTPGHNFIALAQEKPTKPLRPGEAPKTHLLHYKLDSKDIQQSSSGNVGGAGLIANGSDQTTCHNHFVNHGDSGYEEDALSLESSKSSAQHSPDCDNCHHHNHNHHHHHHHHGHHHHGHQHCSDITTSSQVTNPTSNATTSCNNVDDMSSSSSTSLKMSSANSTNTTVTGASGNNTNGNGGSGRTYCRCCYCELFGHSGPPTAPTSHNYTKQRDKMRVKLEMKKQRDNTSSHDHCSCSNVSQHPTHTTATDPKDDRSLDTLLEFINGPEEENHKMSSRAAKRQRRKQRKQESYPPIAEDEGDSSNNRQQNSSKQDDSKKSKSTKKTQQLYDSEAAEYQQKDEVELDSSDDEAEKGRSEGGSDHSSDDLELVAEIMMHRSSCQEFKLASSGNKYDKHQERSHGGKPTSNDVQFNSSVSPSFGSATGAKTQSHNQKVPQQQAQPQQLTTQKSRPANPSATTKPSDQYTTMTSRKQPVQPPSQQQSKETERIDASQKFYSGDYNGRLPQSQRQVNRDKDVVGRDSRETRFHYAPNPNRIKQLPPRFQRMAQEQLANQQQQQQQQMQQQHPRSRYNAAPAYSHSHLMSSNSQGATQKRENAHTGNATTLDDVFMPKDDTLDAEDGEMDETDRELEEFKRFCFMNKPLENRPKVALKVNLKELTLKKT